MHFTIKPVSYVCNLKCDYCFYLPKGENLLHKGLMTDEVLEALIVKYIKACAGNRVYFTWQGGEPLLAGKKFYEKAFALQQKHARGKIIENAIQTNATLLDDEFCELFKQHNCLMGVSIDGPQELHDALRKDKRGHGTYQQVIAGIELLKKHDIPFNTLTCINAANYQQPLAVYNALKELGSTFMQFSEVVETTPENSDFSHVPSTYTAKPFSLSKSAYGTFMSEIFRYWVAHDIGTIHVRQFETFISRVLGGGHLSCVFEDKCPDNFVLEANGDIYECDQAVYPTYKIGNILTSDLTKLHSERINVVKHNLSNQCHECPYLALCSGGCPKHRLDLQQGTPITYFCEGYKILFKTMVPYLNAMGALEENKIPYLAIKDIAPRIAAMAKE